MDIYNIYNSLRQSKNDLIGKNGVNLLTTVINDNNVAIEIALAESVKVIIDYFNIKLNESERLGVEIAKIAKFQKNRVSQLEEKHQRDLAKIEEQQKRERAEYEKALSENKLYKERYGTLVDPDDMIIEFWNNESIGKWGLLVPPSRWKRKLHGEKGTTARRYWISTFKKIGLLEVWGNGKYRAKLTQKEALEVLHKHLVSTNVLEEKVVGG